MFLRTVRKYINKPNFNKYVLYDLTSIKNITPIKVYLLSTSILSGSFAINRCKVANIMTICAYRDPNMSDFDKNLHIVKIYSLIIPATFIVSSISYFLGPVLVPLYVVGLVR